MRYLVTALCALAVFVSGSFVANAGGPKTLVVICGVVAANSITSGEGSGPRTYELLVTSGPGGGGRFSVAPDIALPTIGSYICGQFEEGVPMNGLVALLRPGDAGYVARSLPSTTVRPETGTTLVIAELVAIGLALLVAVGLLTARSRRSVRD